MMGPPLDTLIIFEIKLTHALIIEELQEILFKKIWR